MKNSLVSFFVMVALALGACGRIQAGHGTGDTEFAFNVMLDGGTRVAGYGSFNAWWYDENKVFISASPTLYWVADGVNQTEVMAAVPNGAQYALILNQTGHISNYTYFYGPDTFPQGTLVQLGPSTFLPTYVHVD